MRWRRPGLLTQPSLAHFLNCAWLSLRKLSLTQLCLGLSSALLHSAEVE
jgi:hypothetical protein